MHCYLLWSGVVCDTTGVIQSWRRVHDYHGGLKENSMWKQFEQCWNITDLCQAAFYVNARQSTMWFEMKWHGDV